MISSIDRDCGDIVSESESNNPDSNLESAVENAGMLFGKRLLPFKE